MNKILRFLLGLLTGFTALIAFSMAPWALAYQGFSWLSGYGLIFFAGIVTGAFLLWAAIRLIRPVISMPQPSTNTNLPNKSVEINRHPLVS